MSFEVYAAFLLFILAASFSPGPNNVMMMTSGSLFGCRATLPHIAGVEIGFASLLMAVIFGMDLIIERWPWLLLSLRILGGAWLIWFGWQFVKVALWPAPASENTPETQNVRPLRFYEAFLFQWINPKGLMMATSCAGSFVMLSPSVPIRATILGLSCFIIGTVACFTWTMAGSQLSSLFQSGKQARLVQGIMGILLIAMALTLFAI